MIQNQFMLGPVKCSTYNIIQLLSEVRQLLNDSSEQPRTINCINAHIFNLAWKNDALTNALNQSRVVAVDGMSIVWISPLFSTRLSERCNMTESLRAFLMDSSFPKTKAILIGGTEEIAEKAATALNEANSHLTVVETLSGYLPNEAYQEYFEISDPVDFVLLGLGTPKSELLSQIISDIWPKTIIWHIGGGTILFLSGNSTEAPLWMRRSGLQWLHRLIMEPKRMWKRYLLGNILFLLRCLYSFLWKIGLV